MIRTILFGVALGITAVTATAQTPAPAPRPAPAPVPTPAPRDEPVPVLTPEPADVFDSAIPHLELAMPLLPPLPPLPPESFELPGSEDLFHYEDKFPIDPLLQLEPLEPLMQLDMVKDLDPFPPLEPMLPDIQFEHKSPPPMPDFYHTPASPDVARVPAIASRFPGRSQFEQQFGDLTSEPPQSWAQSDPADSLYRLARQTLNRGEYRRAAQLFGDITQRFPNSAYAADARYWRAFALYRIGGTPELREALAALESDGRRYHQASLKVDAATLASRIRGALAQRGDVRAITQVEREAGKQGDSCDREEAAVRLAALSSLGDMDQESTTPIFRRILAKRDICSASLRRNALFLLAKRGDPEATALIIASARNDTDPHVRSEALRWLAKMPGDQALATLEEIARTSDNESLQRSAVAALARSESPRARLAIRNIIERNDVSESLRAIALASVVGEHSADGGAYLRSVYPRLQTSRLKLGAIRAVAKIGGSENERWLLSLVRNQSEPLDVRSAALSYAGRSDIAIGDLVAMYDAAGERPLRTRLISLYGSRSEPEAANKLASIAKTGTDPELRRMAISALSRRNDPRTRQLLLEILDQ